VSINLEKRTDAPGDATHEAAAWALKERIRREDGVLKQRRGFFSDAYRRSKTYLLYERGPDENTRYRGDDRETETRNETGSNAVGGGNASSDLKRLRERLSNDDTDEDTDVPEQDDDLVGFISVRRDGYILFLAVSPDARGRGYGKRLVAEVADEHRTVTCHARSTNRAALDFYDAIGFEAERRIEGYYEDGGDAYYLKLGSEGGLKERLSKFLR
jgi:ribosomal protein S18 acetylase RimI-like enzyme